MQKYRFYAEMPDNRRSKSASRHFGAFTRKMLERLAAAGGHVNCIAVLLENGKPLWCGIGGLRMDAIACDVERGNGPVVLGTVDRDYLRQRCVRITADLAAKLHPRLATYLK